MHIAIQDVTKRFGDFVALANISLEIRSGELVALLGPSGSGKTTLLRIIAGLDWPDGGMLHFDGYNALTYGAAERHVGFVFQHYALFRHMTIFENVAFGLRARPRRQRLSEEGIRKKVGDLLDLVQLHRLAERYPHQLSGGQRQRVALARALAVEPRVLLLDEPFGALDAKVRKELRRWLRHLHEEIQVTSLFVTHDQEEALEVADRIVVLDRGRIAQVGTPQQVYDEPVSDFVHQFIGESVSLPVTIDRGRIVFGKDVIDVGGHGHSDGKAVLCVRPYDIVIQTDSFNGGFRGRVTRIYDLGPGRRAEIALKSDDADRVIEVIAPHNVAIGIGQIVNLSPLSYRIFAQRPS